MLTRILQRCMMAASLLTFLAMTSGESVRLMRLPSTGSDLLIFDVPSTRDMTRAPSLTIRAYRRARGTGTTSHTSQETLNSSKRHFSAIRRLEHDVHDCPDHIMGSEIVKTIPPINKTRTTSRKQIVIIHRNTTLLTWGSLNVFLLRLQNLSLNLCSTM